MNNELDIKIEISMNWHNPYKNGHYKEIDIFIQNKNKDDIVIKSINLVCNGKLYPVNKNLFVSLITAESENNIERDTSIYQLLEFHSLIAYDFYLLIKHSQGESKSNTINIASTPTDVC